MKTFIAIPCFEHIEVDFVSCIENLNRVGLTSVNFLAGSLVYDARENLLDAALKEKADYILWLDSDMTFDPNLLNNLIASGKDFVSGLYFRRKPPFSPVIFKTIKLGFDGQHETENYDQYPENQLFEIDACGFGAVLMKSEMAIEMHKKDKTLFAPIPGYGEDISFCIRAKRAGYDLWCDSRVKLGHIAKTVADEATYKGWRERYGSNT